MKMQKKRIWLTIIQITNLNHSYKRVETPSLVLTFFLHENLVLYQQADSFDKFQLPIETIPTESVCWPFTWLSVCVIPLWSGGLLLQTSKRSRRQSLTITITLIVSVSPRRESRASLIELLWKKCHKINLLLKNKTEIGFDWRPLFTM